MGIVPERETKRDKKLIKDYLAGSFEKGWKYSISEIGLKYARKFDGRTIPLTATRIHQILDRYGVEKKRTLRSHL